MFLLKATNKSIINNQVTLSTKCIMPSYRNKKDYMFINQIVTLLLLVMVLALTATCKKTEDNKLPCDKTVALDKSRGECNEDLGIAPLYKERLAGNERIITSNSIPNHDVGLFGRGSGSLNPNRIRAVTKTYNLALKPDINEELTPLLNVDGPGKKGPQYSFGILLNGIELDPVAAEPFPHDGNRGPDANWAYNLEALNVNLGLDCNNAHVQPSGKYHYHGSPPPAFLENLNAYAHKMTLVGYAADGFPIYYKYAFKDANDSSSDIVQMKSSYQLKSGDRPDNGIDAPCGPYDGIYSSDYEYVAGKGQLDEANGRTGVTPEFPEGTFYYLITDDFPSIPRYFRGSPSDDFKIGR